MTPDEIKGALADRALSVCEHLFPAGKVDGHEFCVGSVAGEPGQSLRINVNGRPGVWADFASDEKGGNLLELWRLARGHQDIRETMREAAEWLGSPAGSERTSAAPPEPEPEPEGEPVDPPDRHPNWRTAPEGRWPYRDRDGRPIVCAYRYDPPGKSKVMMYFDCRRGAWVGQGGKLPNPTPLLHLDLLARDPDAPVVFVEGEKCARLLVTEKILATTTLGGCGQVRKADLEPLAGRTVTIWPDNDGPGAKYADHIARRLVDLGCTVKVCRIPEGTADGWDAYDAWFDPERLWRAPEVREFLDQAVPWQSRGSDNDTEADPEEGAAVGPEDARRQESKGAANEAGPRYSFVGLDHALNQKPIEYLADEEIPCEGTGVLAGFPGGGKSLKLIDWSLKIAIEKRVPVAYIVAEGYAGLGQRLRAWFAYHRQEPEGVPIYLLPAAPQLNTAKDLTDLLEAIERLPVRPGFTVIDTLARTLVGDENSSKDVGAYITAIDSVQRVTGGFVMVAHHTGWAQERERGSSSLRGAVDVLALISKEDSAVRMECLKSKDAAPFGDRHFDLVPWEDSVVLVPVTKESRKQRPDPLPPLRQKALDALRGGDDGKGLSFTSWLEISGLTRPTFKRCVADLGSWGLAEKRSGKWVCP